MYHSRRELELAVAALPEGWVGTLDDAFQHLHLRVGYLANIEAEIDDLMQLALDHLGEATPQRGVFLPLDEPAPGGFTA